VAQLPLEKMQELERRLAEVEARMSEGPAPDVYVKLAAEYAELQPVVTRISNYLKAKDELAGLRALLNDSGTDREMRELASLELGHRKRHHGF
jgi:peptide chain release factor 1